MKPWAKIAFWLVVAGQLVFLVGFIAVKETSLRSGVEVVLQAVPVDPRSLFQGDYAILDYEIAELPEHMEARPGETVYVVLHEGPEVWEWRRYSYARPPSSETFIRGRIKPNGRLDFGIGTYFVPEGTGRIVETAEDVKVVVKLDTDGDAIISEVLVNGETFNPRPEP